MRNLRFWIPTIIGAVLTPVFLFAAAVSTGAGHGSYAATMVLYPVSMMIMVSFAVFAHSDAFVSQTIQTISLVVVIGLAILQFPLYGFVLSYAHLKDKWWLTIAGGIIYLHLLAVAVWLIIAGIMWAVSS